MPEHRSEAGHAAAEEISGAVLTFRYVVALAILAIIAVASHVSFTKVLRENGGSTYLNLVSSQQQTAAQRMARYGIQYTAGDDGARGRLMQETDAFEAAHRQLIAHMEARKLPEAVIAALKSVYYGNADLKTEIDRYIAEARDLAAAGPGSPAMKDDAAAMARDADGPVYGGLKQIVDLYDGYTVDQLRRLERMQNYMLAMMFLTLAMEVVIIFNPMVQRIMRYTADLVHLASTDPLTGLLNRRSFLEKAYAEVKRARREGKPSCLLAIDADHFKHINDTHGHLMGDTVLKVMANAIAGHIRKTDVLGRTGGEEFAVLLPEVPLDMALQMAERLRTGILQLEVATEAAPVHFSISIGVTQVRMDEGDLAPALSRADKALYAAKEGGRNRVVASSGLDNLPPARFDAAVA